MLTPIDIQNREIKSKMGGYDKKDVDDFLEEIRGSYEELYKENQSLKEKIGSLSEGIQYYKKMESTLQKALVLAEKTSTETQEAAKTQADSVMSEATAKAEAMTREAKAEIESLRREAQAQTEITKAKANRELEETRNHVRKLVQSYENYRLQFKKLAEAQIEMLDSESFSIFVPELEELMNEAPSADMVMDDPGIIPINIGSPAPFVELPDDNADAPKVEEVPVEPVSFTVPVSSEGSFSDIPADNTESATGSIADVAGVNAEQEPASTLNEGITLNVSSDITSDTAPAAEDNGVSLDVSSVDMSPVGDISLDISSDSPAQTEAESSVSLDLGLDIPTVEANAPSTPAADPMLMDIPGITTPAKEPAVAVDNGSIGGGESASNDILGGADMFADDNMIGGTEPVANEPVSNDMLGGADMFGGNDLIGGTEPVASEPVANDLLGGADMFGGNDLIGGTEPAASEPVSNDILGGSDLIGGSEPAADDLIGGGTDMFATNDLIGGSETTANDLIGGTEPAANDLIGGADMFNTNDLIGGTETVAETPAAAEPAPAADGASNGIIDDPLMDLGGMFETPGVTPAPTAQPQAPAMDANPFSFIDPEL